VFPDTVAPADPPADPKAFDPLLPFLAMMPPASIVRVFLMKTRQPFVERIAPLGIVSES
jgi:hypothetical protein